MEFKMSALQMSLLAQSGNWSSTINANTHAQQFQCEESLYRMLCAECFVPTYNDVFQSIAMQEQFPERQQIPLIVRGLLIQVQHLICPEVQLRASCNRPRPTATTTWG